MLHALILNLAIIVATTVLTIVTHNPLCLAGLLTLREMPFGLLAALQSDDDPPSRGIGFTAE